MVIGKKIFFDTNVLIRYAIKDDDQKYKTVLKLFEKVESGSYIPYLSAIVLLEIFHILTKTYQLKSENVDLFIKYILSLRNLVLINKTDFEKAFTIHQKTKIKLADCLIASSVPKNCHLITWDKDFNKIKTIKKATPDQLL